jgi:hypothetical protein
LLHSDDFLHAQNVEGKFFPANAEAHQLQQLAEIVVCAMNAGTSIVRSLGAFYSRFHNNVPKFSAYAMKRVESASMKARRN